MYWEVCIENYNEWRGRGIIIIAEVPVKTTVNNNDVIETNLSNKG